MPAALKQKKLRQAAPAPALSELSKRVQGFRLKRNLTYKELATLVGGISTETIRRAELGFPLTIRISSKIETFLADMEGARHVA